MEHNSDIYGLDDAQEEILRRYALNGTSAAPQGTDSDSIAAWARRLELLTMELKEEAVRWAGKATQTAADAEKAAAAAARHTEMLQTKIDRLECEISVEMLQETSRRINRAVAELRSTNESVQPTFDGRITSLITATQVLAEKVENTENLQRQTAANVAQLCAPPLWPDAGFDGPFDTQFGSLGPLGLLEPVGPVGTAETAQRRKHTGMPLPVSPARKRGKRSDRHTKRHTASKRRKMPKPAEGPQKRRSTNTTKTAVRDVRPATPSASSSVARASSPPPPEPVNPPSGTPPSGPTRRRILSSDECFLSSP